MADMPPDRLPYTHHEQTRHGTWVWYFRRGKGPRTRLNGAYKSPEFMADYAAALAGAGEIRKGKNAKGTMNWLVAEWKKSPDWAKTAAATRKQRDNILSRALDKCGHEPVKHITSAVIERSRDTRADRPFAANNYLKAMRALFGWAKAKGHVRENPALDVAFLPDKTDGYPTWTEDEVTAYTRRWKPGTREWMMLQVLLHTGLRRGDAAVLGRPHVRDGIITIRTEKTGEIVSIPVLPELEEALKIGPVGEMTFIATREGRPITKETLGNAFRFACRAAGIEKSAHGLRKLAATRFSEAGVSEDQLDAWFGWGTIGMSRKYTTAARRKVQAKEAAKKLLESRKIPAPVSDGPAPEKYGKKIKRVAAGNRKVVGGEINE